MITLTKKRLHILDEWVGRYDIIDYWADTFSDRFVFYGSSRDRKFYKKIIR